MLRRMWLSLRRDNLINWRNYYYLVALLVALVYMGLVNWVVPAETSLKPDVYVVDQTQDGRFATYVRQQQGGDAQLLADEQALRAQMAANQNSIGVVLTPGEGTSLPQAQLFFQGHENEKVRNLLGASLGAELRQLYGEPYPRPVAVEQQTLRDLATVDAVPFNKGLVPFLLFSDTAMIGLLFIAALIFMEKDEGTLRAYWVTPGRTFEYLLSKALTLAVLALLFTLVFVPLTIGWGPNYPQLLAVMFMGSVFGSLLGALIAVYFDSLTEFIFPAMLVMVVISLPSITYWVPSFSPAWLEWMPTYPLMFGLREATFPTGNVQVVYNSLLALLGVNVALLFVTSLAFKRQLVRG
jgi:hypothetical protein